MANTSSGSSSPRSSTSVTSGLPLVIVPVLSNTIALIWQALSRGSPPLIKIPCSAPLPVPTIMAVGVASPRAQGQAITITAVNAIKAKESVAPSRKYHTPNVAMATIITAGTNQAEIRSATAWMGAFDPWASSTSRIIWERVVSAPTRVALNSKLPVLFMVPPMTKSSGFFSTGRLSPVIMDSSTADTPVIITPSTGIFSPGLTTRISSLPTCSMGISRVCPFLTTRAVLACNPMSFLIASEVRPLALASRNLPKITNVIKKAAVSKYNSGVFTPPRP